jgi:hypothetical protein
MEYVIMVSKSTPNFTKDKIYKVLSKDVYMASLSADWRVATPQEIWKYKYRKMRMLLKGYPK